MNTEEFSVVIGKKQVRLARQADGSWIAACTCPVLNCPVHIPLKDEEVRRLFAPGGRQGLIQDILPNTPRQLREIFVTGMTPAELDRTFSLGVRPRKAYRRLGYQC